MVDLIAIDLDGTLLTDERKVTKENYEAIHYALKKGVKVVLCTGRPYLGMNHVVEEVGLTSDDDYIITFNGSLVQKASDGEILARNTMTFDDLKIWKEELDRLKLPLNVIDEDYVYYPSSYPDEQSSIYLSDVTVAPSQEKDFESFEPDHDFNKFVIAINEEYLDQQLEDLNPALLEKYSVVKSHPFLLEVMSKGTHKAKGISQLAEFLNIDRSRIMGIGDQENDQTMIEWAGIGVGMDNAVDAVKEVSDDITASNNDSGVAQAIYKYVK